MESFCHQLNKPPGGMLHAKKAEPFINLVVVLKNKGQCFSTELDCRKHPKVSDLLKPCGRLTAFLQGPKLTVQDDGQDVLNDIRMDSMTPLEALNELLEASCQQSKVLAESLTKTRDTRNVSNEACELIMKIEQQRKEEFAKFALLLNEKKRKIRELQERTGGAVTESVVEDDYGLSADVQKMSQETNRSGGASQRRADLTESPPPRDPTKRRRIEHRIDNSDDDHDEADKGAGTSRGGTKDKNFNEDDADSARSNDEDLVDSDEEHSDKGRHSEPEDDPESEEEDEKDTDADDQDVRAEKESKGDSKRTPKAEKRRVVSDEGSGQEDSDDNVKVAADAKVDGQRTTLKPNSSQQTGAKKARSAISDDDSDDDGSPKAKGLDSMRKLRTVRPMGKHVASQLDALDDLL